MRFFPSVPFLAAVLSLSAGCEKKQPDMGPAKVAETKPTNVILISVDTLRADHLGCYGYQRPTTPTLDKLASQGLLFEHVSTTSPWTKPAHASLLTGLYPSRHGLKGRCTQLPEGIPTLGSILSQAGFATAAIVNSFYLDGKYGYDRSFDHYVYIQESNGQVGIARDITAQATEWILQHRQQPFFLFLHYYDVHGDYRSPPKYEKQFVRPYNGIADGTIAQFGAFRHGQIAFDDDDAKHLIDLYDAGIRMMDDDLAVLFQFLETQGLRENTLLIVTSDHGEEFLEHGGVLHTRTQFQEVIHVPLIMRGPRLPPGRRIKETASLLDVMPTILALCNVAAPSFQEGVDLRPLWQDGASPLPPRFIFAEADLSARKTEVKRAVRHKQYKLHYDISTKQVQLYDVLADPLETIDISPDHPAVVDLLLEQLMEFMRIDNTCQPLGPLSPEEIQKLKSLGYVG